MDQNKGNILVVDDEEQIVSVVKAYLEREGYRIFVAYGGKEALEVFNKEKIDFVVLDLMMPDLSGEDVCKKIRLESPTPILMLTAKVEEDNRIYGLDIGADDYMTKPFSPKELVARVRAIFRRFKKDTVKAEIIEFNRGYLTIDIGKMDVLKKGIAVNITPTEFQILALLAQNPGQVFSREKLIMDVLGF